jgi:predicted DNA-binding protein (UPF0251 family)
MPRPKKIRLIHSLPTAVFYKPQGIPLQRLKGAVLPVEGLEAIRLADGEGLSQQEAAELMGVSRPTFCRILTEARRIVANALSRGWAIRVDGGRFEVASNGVGKGAGEQEFH